MKIPMQARASRLVAACLSAALTLWAEARTASAARLARPSPQQYAWQEQERILFVCLDPCIWQEREYDNHSTPLTEMKLPKLDTDQWCEAAKSFGAKQIVLVCKHTGGFCWWPTETTDYCVRNIPWKGGKGNLVKDVADACRKHGLKMGVYIYSDDPRYTEGIGRGGRTDDPTKQEEWNRKLRQQWTEVLTICGPDLVREIWFDGGCIVPLEDIIRKLAPAGKVKINSAKLLFNGAEMPAEDCVVEDGKVIVRQTQQVTTQTKTELKLELAPGAPAGNATIRMISER